ncbi:acyl-CoA dehydrogenase family protein [Roseomonas sp. HF4]|uniref:acyl-CoA dehydrogenase family protein n=1 Tax=Roseomonas sp. HF4 TaxID=2562313 RepID=UPI0010BF8485|nr:acyl-CoA dehydrogenase family protein [Roseomonas sp. HF4]
MTIAKPLAAAPAGTASGMSAAGFRAQLRDLAETVAFERAGFDAAGRLPDALYRKLAAIGLFRLWLPAALGGPELTALDFMDVVEEAAALDGTIGWLVGNGGGMGRAGAYLPVDCAWQIFADPEAFVVSGTGGVGRAVPVAGGYRVSGRWPFGSGAPHATWFTPVCEVEDSGRGTGRKIFPYAPRADVVLHDNWQVAGLCATGSVDFELRDVFVPDHFVHAFQPEPVQPGTLYRLPTGSIFPWTVATVPLGLARGALAEFVRLAVSRKRRGDSVPLVERELVQSEIGRIEARLSAGRAYLRQAMTDLLDAVEAGIDLVPTRVRLRLACTFASEGALWAIGRLTEMAGAVAIFRSCPLERYERDARAAAKHVAMSPAAYITGGKLLLERDLAHAHF